MGVRCEAKCVLRIVLFLAALTTNLLCRPLHVLVSNAVERDIIVNFFPPGCEEGVFGTFILGSGNKLPFAVMFDESHSVVVSIAKSCFQVSYFGEDDACHAIGLKQVCGEEIIDNSYKWLYYKFSQDALEIIIYSEGFIVFSAYQVLNDEILETALELEQIEYKSFRGLRVDSDVVEHKCLHFIQL